MTEVRTLATGAADAWRRALVLWRAGWAGIRDWFFEPAPAPGEQAPSRTFRPVWVPDSLEGLEGPASGVTELPVRLFWSGRTREFDLADPVDAALYCEAVLDAAATPADITRYLNADLLISTWPALGMERARRSAWEARFPELRRRRLAAAA
jgi:hypothetical protein